MKLNTFLVDVADLKVQKYLYLYKMNIWCQKEKLAEIRQYKSHQK